MSRTVLLGLVGVVAIYLLPLLWPPEAVGEGAMALAMVATGATVAYGARNFPTPNRAPTSAELRAERTPPGPTRPIPCASDEDED
ncbi:MAG TPA: hypothetical protein VI911_07180 [Patescibacteria group bacterium]|nr:hypothetical protein [Patescibacteria group bacterium]